MTDADNKLWEALGVVLRELDSNSLECRPFDQDRWKAALEDLRREHKRLGKQAARRVKRRM